jgi:predicted ribosome quality control (RQC) complex YloA/Tae2 family protein
MKQKTVDMRKLVQTHLDRSRKKLALQEKQLVDTKDKDKFKIRGELIQANLYQIPEGAEKITVLNYYTNENVDITLNPNLTAVENATKLFDKYNKKKRTKIAVNSQVALTKKEVAHLESIQYTLENAELDADLVTIRNELMNSGYIKFKVQKKDKRMKTSSPFHYQSSDGFDIYVGRNNEQNEYLTLKVARNSDWWFHTKEVPGSHVIVVTKGEELPDRTFEEAAALAAYYSKAKNSTKVTVDYVEKKQLKKPTGSPLGYVIYHTNYSMHITPSKNGLKLIES